MFIAIALKVLLAYAIVCLAACALQSKLVWFPGGPPQRTPRDLGLSHRDVALVASDGVRLSAWLIEAAEAAGVVLHCHGNAGSIEHRIEAASVLTGLGFSVLLFDYRGYGASAGSISEEGSYLDADAAWQRLAREGGFEPARIVAWGESLGAAVAVDLACRRPVAALVTEAAFTSIPDMGARHYPWLPVRLLARIRYDSLARAGDVAAPWLLLHSREDEIVPFEHAQRLFDAARSARAAPAAPVELFALRGGHNDQGFVRSQQARAAVAGFLASALPPAHPR
jgi:fermentation-respiration switch protein FrsA (DUF1100 family)